MTRRKTIFFLLLMLIFSLLQISFVSISVPETGIVEVDHVVTQSRKLKAPDCSVGQKRLFSSDREVRQRGLNSSMFILLSQPEKK